MMGKDFATKAVHFDHIKQDNIHSKVTPLYQTTAFTFQNLDDLEGFYQGDRKYLYSRNGNPNTDEFAGAVASLEETPKAVSASSGLGAITAAILSVAKAGDHILAANDLYGGTVDLLQNELKEFDIEVSLIDFSTPKNIEEAIQGNTVLLYTESVTNPLLRVEDLEKVVQIAESHNLKTLVDNTFATPYLLQPYTLGADLVVHSATKYLGGHSDVTAGVVAGSEALIDKVERKITALGSNLGPFEAWLAVRGLKTLDVRMERHINNAQKLADSLKNNKGIKTVYYPEKVSEKGNGAIVTIDLDDKVDINQFFEALNWIKIVPTLAGIETTVSYPKSTSHRALTDQARKDVGITDQLVRISVGLESSDDLIEEVDQAIRAAKK